MVVDLQIRLSCNKITYYIYHMRLPCSSKNSYESVQIQLSSHNNVSWCTSNVNEGQVAKVGLGLGLKSHVAKVNSMESRLPRYPTCGQSRHVL